MWNISIVSNSGTKVFKYPRNGTGAYGITDAINQAIRASGYDRKIGITSVTATII